MMSLYDKEEHIPLLTQLFRAGKGIMAFCLEAGICKDTFHSWVKRYPEFRQAYGYACILAEYWWDKFIMEDLERGEYWYVKRTIQNRFDRPKMSHLSKYCTLKERSDYIIELLARGEITPEFAEKSMNVLAQSEQINKFDKLETSIENFKYVLNGSKNA